MNETDKKITKALEHCLTVDVAGCSECPYRKGRNCINRLETDALALINRLDVELEAMRGAANSYKMHYDNLAREIFDEIEKALNDIYFEARFIELKRKYVTPDCRDCRFLVGCETACGGVACDMFDPEN